MKILQMEPWYGKEEKNAVIKYLDSGGWITEHKKTRELERMIADYTGSRFCSMVCNGTVSLTAILWALDIGFKTWEHEINKQVTISQDEVIVPDYTMFASASAVELTGAKVVLVDIEKKSLGMSFQRFKEKVTSKTKAVILVSINGRFPVDGMEIIEFCKDENIYVIEDAAQSLGCRFNKKHVGTFGDAGSFSFSMPKIITTGQGGAIVTDDKELHEKIKLVKNFGRKKSGVDQHDVMGFNFKFTDLQAVFGIEQMKKLPWRVKRKKEMFKLYQDLLRGTKGVSFIDTNLEVAPWMMDVLLKDREKVIDFLGQHEVGVRPFYPAIHTQPPYSHVKGDFKNSLEISQHGLWLPSSSKLSDYEIEYVCEKIRRCLDES